MQLAKDRHFAAQNLGDDGYRNVVDSADLVALELFERRDLGSRDKYDWRALEPRVSTNESCDFEPVHSRHVDVEQYGSKVLFQQLLEGFVPGQCADTAYLQTCKHRLVRQQTRRLIINQQLRGRGSRSPCTPEPSEPGDGLVAPEVSSSILIPQCCYLMQA